MSFREEKKKLLEGINVTTNDDDYANCVVCHERDTGNLIDVWLPVSKTTLCKECASELSGKITEGLKV